MSSFQQNPWKGWYQVILEYSLGCKYSPVLCKTEIQQKEYQISVMWPKINGIVVCLTHEYCNNVSYKVTQWNLALTCVPTLSPSIWYSFEFHEKKWRIVIFVSSRLVAKKMGRPIHRVQYKTVMSLINSKSTLKHRYCCLVSSSILNPTC